MQHPANFKRLERPLKRAVRWAERALILNMIEVHTIVAREMHNFHLLLNNITITTHIHIGSTLLYTLGFCRLGPTRILLFCWEFVAAAAAEVGVSKKQ